MEAAAAVPNERDFSDLDASMVARVTVFQTDRVLRQEMARPWRQWRKAKLPCVMGFCPRAEKTLCLPSERERL
jgi:hypothetical protein